MSGGVKSISNKKVNKALPKGNQKLVAEAVGGTTSTNTKAVNDESHLRKRRRSSNKAEAEYREKIEQVFLLSNNVEAQIKIIGPDEKEIYEEDIIVAPDGGWGYMVILGAFYSNAIAEGLVFSFPIKAQEILVSFHDQGHTHLNLTDVSWIYGILLGFYLVAGPVGSVIANKYGFRVLGILGAVIAAFGYIMSYILCLGHISTCNIYSLYVFKGALGGLGLCFVTQPSILAVGFYFEKRRALATGICVCGSGVGTFVFAILLEDWIERFGWKISLVIEAGVILSSCVGASLYRPLKPKGHHIKVSKSSVRHSAVVLHDASDEDVTALNPTDDASNSAIPEVIGDTKTHKNTRVLEDEAASEGSKVSLNLGHAKYSFEESKGLKKLHSKAPASTINKPLYRDDILFRGNMHRIPVYDETVAKGLLRSVDWSVMVTSKPGEGEENNKNKKCKVVGVLRKLLSFEIISSPTFILYAVSNMLTMLVFFIPLLYLEGLTVDYGLDATDTTKFLSAYGIANIVGRIFGGLLADCPHVSASILNCIALVVAGVATAIAPFCRNFWLFAAYSACYGATTGMYVGLASIVIVELFDLANLTNIFGISYFLQGIITFLGAPLGGLLKDSTGDYKLSFYFSGAVLVLAGLAMAPILHLQRWEAQRKQTKLGYQTLQ